MTNLDSVFHSEDDLFYFESDQLALKGNKDYCEVLKTIVILTAQRERALKDISKVVELKKEYLDNPSRLLEKLKNGESLDLPPVFELPRLPVIDFNSFNVKIPEEELRLIYDDENQKSTKPTVGDLKPERTNKSHWTPEEQKRLEELLIKFPPEPIELRRFQKISNALGNRTLAQVTSRIQKYFLKLYKAGLPIPGRVPKSCEKYRKNTLHKHQRNNHYLWKPTTFFPDLYVPVVMDELENIPGPSTSSAAQSFQSQNSPNYLVMNNEYQQSGLGSGESEDGVVQNETELQLEILQRVKAVKLYESEDGFYPFKHEGFKCDYCDEQPIVGSRWHCVSCTTTSIDFCTDCILSQMYSEFPHPLLHRLVIYQDEEVSSPLHSDDTPSSDSNQDEKSDSSDDDSSNIESSNLLDLNGVETVEVKLENMESESDDSN